VMSENSLTKVHSSLSIQSRLLSRQISPELTIEIGLGVGQLGPLIDAIIHTLLDPLIEGSLQELSDIQGRTPGRPLTIPAPGPQPRSTELLYIYGELDRCPTFANPHSDQIWCTVESVFKRFGRPGQITNGVVVTRSESLPDWLPWQALGRAVPIRPSYVRGGIELFEGRAISAMFGVAPIVKEWVVFEADQERMIIVLHGSQVLRNAPGPMRNLKVQSLVAQLLDSVFAVSLSDVWTRTPDR